MKFDKLISLVENQFEIVRAAIDHENKDEIQMIFCLGRPYIFLDYSYESNQDVYHMSLEVGHVTDSGKAQEMIKTRLLNWNKTRKIGKTYEQILACAKSKDSSYAPIDDKNQVLIQHYARMETLLCNNIGNPGNLSVGLMRSIAKRVCQTIFINTDDNQYLLKLQLYT